MPITKNTWNKGLSSDLSKLKSQPDSYLYAKNIRVITDLGESTLAVENIRGNKYSFRIPAVSRTFKLDFTGLTGLVTLNFFRIHNSLGFTGTITINVTGTDTEIIAERINDQLIANPFPYSQYIKAYYNSDYIVIYDFLPQSVRDGNLPIVGTTTGLISITSPEFTPTTIPVRTNEIVNHTILGWGYYNDNLVLITCAANSTSETPSDTEGFIWDAKYINSTNLIENEDTTAQGVVYLNPQYHLKYAGKLNLSREYAIVKHLKCRFENVDIARIVWTDWYNHLRTCNLLDPQIWATPEELFDYIPNHIPQKPIVRRLIPGGTLPTGKYQYYYQLYSNQGAKSTISPVSNLITLYAGTTAGNTLDYANPGNVPGTSSQKSVQVDVINLDVNYDTIRFGYVVYQIPDFPEAFWFDERPVPDDGTITVVHNGNENDIPMDFTEIANLNRPPEVYKTIEVARNRLFAANARTTYFDLTDVFDARAYRFSPIGPPLYADLYNDSDVFGTPSVRIESNGSSITDVIINGISGNTLDQIPETYDLINPFNNENLDPALNPFNGLDSTNPSIGGWLEKFLANDQYRYQLDGATLGGSGLNISYRFTTEDSVVQSGGNYLPTDSPYIRPLPDYNSAYTGEFNDTYIYPGGNGQSLDTHKSSLFETLFVGYARGEVYRFGIVFYDKKGFPSYPLWIGDIKFPFASDQDSSSLTYGLTKYDSDSSTLFHDIITKQIGIEFTLDTSTAQFQAIKDQITGWSYVRLKRDLNNSSRLGTGYIQPTLADNGFTYANLIPFKNDNNNINLRWCYEQDSGGNPISPSKYIIALQTFNAPNFYTRAAGDFQPGDYIRFLARTTFISVRPNYGIKINNPAIWTGAANWNGYYVKPNEYNYQYTDAAIIINQSQTAANYKFPILDKVFVNYSTNQNSVPAAAINQQTSPVVSFRNMTSALYADINTSEYGEWGGECDLVAFDNTNQYFPWAANTLLTVGHPDTFNVFESSENNNEIYLGLYLVSYERFLTKQYGGDTRAARYSNEYILTNHFMPYDKDTVTGLVINGVWGGDTYVNLFDYQRSNVNYKQGSGWDAAPNNDNNTAVGVFYPAESFFNTELNTKEQHASVRLNQPSGSDSIFAASYIYNPAYSQQNTTNVFISKAYLQTNIKYEPHTIYGSEPKLDGERLDAWRSILVNNALGVNGNYGEINRLIEFKDKLYYYQNDGFGIASVDERVLTNEGDTTQTQLGTGTLLQRFDYISTETGSKHSFAVEKTGSAIYHYDAFINKLFKFSLDSGAAPITDIEGLSGFFRTAFVNSNLKSLDKLTRISRVGITSGYNSEYNSIYFTFFDTSNGIKQTISYNEALEAFESFYDFYPSLYINMRKRFLSILFEPTISSANDRVYIHNIGNRNIFYNTPYSSEIKFRVNDKSDFVKTFDNFQLNTEVISPLGVQLPSTVTQMQLSNDYQTYPLSNVSFEQKIRSWRLQIPRDETNPNLTIKPRFSDKYLDVTFKYLDVSNNLFRLHDVITEYSLRSKILPR
jgi:hypothetical protein